MVHLQSRSVTQRISCSTEIAFASGGAGAPGALFHWVTTTDGGLRVTDVWEGRERFQKFADAQIGPYTQEAGVPGPAEIPFYDVHNYLTAG